MNHASTFLARLFVVLSLFPACPTVGQSILMEPDDARRERIAENLKFRFPQLRESEVEVMALSPSPNSGFDEGVLSIDGRSRMRFLTTNDDSRLYLLAAEPVDASMSVQEITLELEKQRVESRREARERHHVLLDESDGLPSRGPSDAPITIIEFSDFECPFCARASGTVEQVLEKYPERVRLVYRHFPLSRHPWAEPAAIAAICAANQSDDAFWGLHDGYFANQTSVNTGNHAAKSREWVSGYGLEMEAWSSCAFDTDSAEYEAARQQVLRDMESARRFGVTGTPAFFVNGRFISGNQPLAEFDETIQEALADTAE